MDTVYPRLTTRPPPFLTSFLQSVGWHAGSPVRKPVLNYRALRVAPVDESFISHNQGASIMSSINKFLWANPERNLFNQIAVFSVAGLAMSLALAFACDLQIAAQWI
jgi:hypothetical protein